MKKSVLILGMVLLFASQSWSSDKIKFNFTYAELTHVIELYSKASGEKFILAPTVRGKVTLLNPEEITLEEAFAQLSKGLALNGFAAVKHGEGYTVDQARSVMRMGLEVTTILPSAVPERVATWVVTLKNISADDVDRQLRNLTSKYGELNVSTETNQIIITDWTSNLSRIAEILKNIDKPVDPQVAKIVEAERNEALKRKATSQSQTTKTE